MKLFYTDMSSVSIAFSGGRFGASKLSQSIFWHTVSKFSVGVLKRNIKDFVNCDSEGSHLPSGLRLAYFYKKMERA